MSNLIGEELGPYRILEQIGVGGMATVYKAYHAAMDRYVAVKVLPEQMSASAEFRQRFEQEAKVIARLAHAHILPVHEYGQSGGRLYLVMRYVEAGTLKDHLAAGTMKPGEVSRILGQVASALDYAHRLGVVHRDIKPSNVLLDDQGNCYLTDFGLAKMLEASARLTATGVGMGTPAYMSPEQGKGETVDARSDLYSLGVMLYEMVTGRVPYEAETPMAVVLKHISDPLPLPGEVKPGVPPSVERVILKAMAKAPEDRFQTAGEMTAALEAAVRMAPTHPSLPMAAVRAARPAEQAPGRFLSRLGGFAQTGAGRAVLWAAGGLVVLLAFFLILNNVPLKVQVSGGRLEVVRLVEVTPSPSQMPEPTAAAPTETATTAAAVVVAPPAIQTPTPAPEATPTAAPPTVQTPAPVTATPTPAFQTELARAFAEPILAEIASRPPDFEDDLDTPGPEWNMGFSAQGSQSGELETIDGVVRMTLREGSDAFLSSSALMFKDFVLEFDTRQTAGSPQAGQQLFMDLPPNGWIMLNIAGGTGDWGLVKAQDEQRQFLQQGHSPAIAPLGEMNHVLVVVRNSQLAAYLNGQPIAYVQDQDFDMHRQLWFMCYGQPDVVCEFDNIQVWNLEKAAELPAAKATPSGSLQVTQLALYEDAADHLAWSPDGTMLAIGGHNIDLYDVQAQQKTLEIPTGSAGNVTFSPDGTILAWGNHEGVHFWDTAGWSELRTLPGSSGTDDLAFSPDGATLATATGNTVKLWDVSTALNAGVASGAELLTIPAGSSINAVAFSPDGRTVASGGQGDIRLWDVSTVLNAGAASGQEVHTLKGHTSWIKSLAFSPDGALLASGSVDGTVRLWDVAAGRQVRLLSGHTDQVEGVAFSPDGRLLASASWDLTVRLWDVSTALNAGVASGNELASLTGHSGWVTSVAFSPDGTMLASGSGDQMRLWRIQETAAMPEPTPAAVLPVIPIATPLPLSPSAISPENAQRLTTQQTLETDGVKRIAWSPDGELLAVATYHIRLYDGATLAPEYVIDSVQWVYSLAFSPDGSLLAAPTIDGIKLWDTTGWGELQTLAGSKDTADLAFSPDGATLATATGNTVKLWDVSTALNAGVASGAELLTIPAGSSINAVAFSPDGRTVASGGQGDIRLWDVSTVLNAGAASGQEVHTLKGHTSWIKSLAFSPDGALLASGSVDGTVRLWDVAAGRQVRLLSGHTDQVEGVAFSPDGRLLASASWDLTVRLWDVSTALNAGVASGNELASLTGHSGWITSVAFSPDGAVLASGSGDQMRLWSVAP